MLPLNRGAGPLSRASSSPQCQHLLVVVREGAVHCGELDSRLGFKEQQCGQGHQLVSVLPLGLMWKELQGGLPVNIRVPQLTYKCPYYCRRLTSSTYGR